MQANIDELWLQTCITVSFLIHHFTCNYTHKLKTQKMYASILRIERLIYNMRCVFSGLDLPVRYGWQVMPPNTHHSFLPIGNLCLLPLITWTLHRSYMVVLHIKRVLYYRTYFLGELELLERFNWKPTAPDMHRGCSLIQCYHPYAASSYIHRYLLCNYAWQRNSHAFWLHTTNWMTVLLPTLRHFIRTNLDSYSIHVVVSFIILGWRPERHQTEKFVSKCCPRMTRAIF